MVIEISLPHRGEQKQEIISVIEDIARRSYDYQHDGLDVEYIDYGNWTKCRFTFYTDKCDQPQRTKQTLREIEKLLEEYI